MNRKITFGHLENRASRWRGLALVLLVLLMLPSAPRAQEITWQDAVARLAAERTRAETCARLLKRHAVDDEAALSRGELTYSDAKAEVDAVIAGLIVVLAQNGTPPSLSDLEARLSQGFETREAFCAEATALEPDKKDGDRNAIISLLGAALKPLTDAVVVLYKFEREQDQLVRKTIQTQLEATQWASFADIKA